MEADNHSNRCPDQVFRMGADTKPYEDASQHRLADGRPSHPGHDVLLLTLRESFEPPEF